MSAVLTPPVKMTPVASPNRTPSPAVRPATLAPEYHRFSVTDYERMVETGILDADAPVELLEGLVVTKMPRNPAHDGTIQVVNKRLGCKLPTGWDTRVQSAIRLPDESMPEPDLTVVRGDETSYLAKHPGPDEIGIVVEIANTSLRLDSETKAKMYALAGIPCYWVIDLTNRIVVVRSRPISATGFSETRTYGFGEEVPISLDGKPVGTIAVSDLII